MAFDKSILLNKVITRIGELEYDVAVAKLEGGNWQDKRSISEYLCLVLDTLESDISNWTDKEFEKVEDVVTDLGQLERVGNDTLGDVAIPFYGNFQPVLEEIDPTVPSHVKTISTTSISNWDTSFNEVFLKKDVEVVGTSVGARDEGFIFNKGISFTQFVEQVSTKKIDPFISTEVGGRLLGVADADMEVGAPISPFVTALFGRGVITNGDMQGQVDLVGVPEKYSFYNSNGDLDSEYETQNMVQNHLYSEGVIVLGENSWETVVSYSSGEGEYFDNLGDASDIFDDDRVEGSISFKSSIINGKLMSYFGYSNSESISEIDDLTRVSESLEDGAEKVYQDVSADNHEYVYYIYPFMHGALDQVILNGATSVIQAFSILQPIVIENSYGLPIYCRVYRSNAPKAFTGDTLEFK